MFWKFYEFVLSILNYNQGIRGSFFYSPKQDVVGRELDMLDFAPLGPMGPHTCFAKLDSGKIVSYSEMSTTFKKTNNWDDHKYLGRGRFERTREY